MTVAGSGHSRAPVSMSGPLVEVNDLRVKFVTRDRTVHAVNGVDLTLQRGEVLTILGESGSGKSVMLRSLMRLHPPKPHRISGAIRIAAAGRGGDGGRSALRHARPHCLHDLPGADAGLRSGLPPSAGRLPNRSCTMRR